MCHLLSFSFQVFNGFKLVTLMYLLWTVIGKSHIVWLTHISLPAAWFCIPEFMRRELFGKPIKHARWQASLVRVTETPTVLNAAQHHETEVKDGHFLTEGKPEMLWQRQTPQCLSVHCHCNCSAWKTIALPQVHMKQWPCNHFLSCRHPTSLVTESIFNWLFCAY